jgi:predicted flavoprotein YhiN
MADMVIITTGGNAYTHTGSTGDGYSFARAMGHSITDLGPSLNSFLTAETWPHSLSGTVFGNGGWRISSQQPVVSSQQPVVSSQNNTTTQ